MKYKSLRKIAKYISNSLMPKLPSWNTSGHKFSHTIFNCQVLVQVHAPVPTDPSSRIKVPKKGLTLESHGPPQKIMLRFEQPYHLHFE